MNADIYVLPLPGKLVPAPRVRKSRRKPRAPSWPAPAALRPVAWGKPDAVLGAAVCRAVEQAMPATPWQFQPSRTWFVLHSRIGSVLAWGIVAAVLLLTLAGARA